MTKHQFGNTTIAAFPKFWFLKFSKAAKIQPLDWGPTATITNNRLINYLMVFPQHLRKNLWKTLRKTA